MLNLDSLLYFAGVSADYLDYSGNLQQVPRDVRVRILDAMALPIADQQAIDELVFAIDAKPWQEWAKPFNLLQQGAPLTMTFAPAELAEEFHWRIVLENTVLENSVLEGSVLEDQTELAGIFRPEEFPECGEYLIDDIRYVARQIPLPLLPFGYHAMHIRCGDDSRSVQLAVCPERCYEPSPKGDRLWGISCQLYTLRSARNWGIGDFLDLTELIELLAPLGADVIGLNPFHAPCSDSPDAASPYSPSDRRFLNPLYIAPEEVDEYSAEFVVDVAKKSAAALEWLRREPLVDYEKVSRLKYQLYENLYGEFCRRHQSVESPRFNQFEDFIAEQGEPLHSFCAYEVVHNAYAAQFAAEPRFYAYLQWLAFSQLQQCQQLALDKGMKIGLMGDIAVGSVIQGNEVKSNPDIYRKGATIGAPPDPFSSSGQDWGLPVIDPLSLRQSHYRHFIQLLRANLSCYGAIRIDHAMSLMRLWWCLAEEGEQQRAGAYVYFHVQDMLALLRLESHRGHCQVIGEDLGVVPREFRELMQANALMGNTLFYFEQDYSHNFRAPHEHREQVALMVTNHDVPTLADWWAKSDIKRRFDLAVIKSEDELAAVCAQRRHEKGQLLHLLGEQQLLADSWQCRDTEKPFDFDLCLAIHRLCARSASRWVLFQLEDLQLMTEPVNIPGTYREYPNWRRKQLRATGDILADSQVVQLLRHISQERIRAHS